MATVVSSPQVAPARAPCRRRVKQIALALLSLPRILAAFGLSYEAIMAAGDARRYPAPGQLVDVGGHWLHINCVGTESPTVVFEAGHGGTSFDWSLVQPQLASETRVCAYDRAGSGWSESGPMPRTPERVVDELHTLLANAGERAPYVMVAHSLGGRYVRLFAQRYPDEVTGMVLVDARSEYHDLAISEKARADLIAQNQPGSMLTWMRRLGVMRMFGAQIYTSQLPELAKLSPETQRAFAVLGARPKAQEAGYSQLVHMSDSDEIVQAANLGDMPLRVLASAQTIAMEPTWLPGQERQAALSTNSVLRTLPGGHYLPLANADEVSAAIRDVVQIKN